MLFPFPRIFRNHLQHRCTEAQATYIAPAGLPSDNEEEVQAFSCLARLFTSSRRFLEMLEEIIGNLISSQLLDPRYLAGLLFLRQIL